MNKSAFKTLIEVLGFWKMCDVLSDVWVGVSPVVRCECGYGSGLGRYHSTPQASIYIS